MKLIDNYNRKLNYLRISITDRCNLNCLYCRPREVLQKLSHTQILRYEEIIRLVKIFASLGTTKVRITGGEPLIRKGVYDFLKSLSRIKELTDISLTTNGVLLKDNIEKIKAAGIKRINISLDSLENKKFQTITGEKQFIRVWEGIIAAHKAGFHPIKINAVALRGINDDELINFAKLTLTYPFQIRFIEYMPFGMGGNENKKYQILSDQIKQTISAIGKLIEINSNNNSEPARLYKFEGAKGEIGLISPISSHFCASCNRLRLTANGNLRTCLLSENETDLFSHLREGASDKELKAVILNAVSHKPEKHKITASDQSHLINKQMSSIGG